MWIALLVLFFASPVFADRIIIFTGPKPDLIKINVALTAFDPTFIGADWDSSGKLIIRGGNGLTEVQIIDAASANPFVPSPDPVNQVIAELQSAISTGQIKQALIDHFIRQKKK